MLTGEEWVIRVEFGVELFLVVGVLLVKYLEDGDRVLL